MALKTQEKKNSFRIKELEFFGLCKCHSKFFINSLSENTVKKQISVFI